ncbi:Pectin lyase-like superfamily protein [Zea mays]|uniref:Pectin lyase-like superfamily protein n=1 Tax=Zea mays TaxID=4577 RepID=A0A1D6LRM7_MAIZE|nr:Pectin lyase-like superfamily protein [Zea mays]
MDLSQYKEHGNWIEILRVDNLVITGKGNLDGLGPAVWSKNSCAKKYKTTFGVRIKAYEDAASVLTVSKIHYENIKMEDSANPIFIDMKYCPNKLCTANDASKVTVKDVTFKNITGTSSTPEAVSLLCSAKIPCTGVTMDDINVEYSGTNNKTMAICTNAKGSTKGCLKELACF